MVQLHKRFSDEQVIFLLQAYEQDLISREEVQDAVMAENVHPFEKMRQKII